MILERLVHKLVDLIRDLFLLVEQDLFFIVLPVQSEVLHSNAVPVIGKLHSRRINDPLDFIWNDKLKVLSSIFIADKKTILDLDHSHHIFVFQLVFIWLVLILHC